MFFFVIFFWNKTLCCGIGKKIFPLCTLGNQFSIFSQHMYVKHLTFVKKQKFHFNYKKKRLIH